MEDRRLIKRRQIIFYLQVFNQETNELIGHLVDITPEGIMLMSDKPLEEGQKFKLKMLLPHDQNKSGYLLFEAMTKWCNQGYNADYYDIGFHIEFISSKDTEIIEEMVKYAGFNE